ncbi:unnamed protein product, partial [Discosporangium mesarthrocarpum]
SDTGTAKSEEDDEDPPTPCMPELQMSKATRDLLFPLEEEEAVRGQKWRAQHSLQALMKEAGGPSPPPRARASASSPVTPRLPGIDGPGLPLPPNTAAAAAAAARTPPTPACPKADQALTIPPLMTPPTPQVPAAGYRGMGMADQRTPQTPGVVLVEVREGGAASL